MHYLVPSLANEVKMLLRVRSSFLRLIVYFHTNALWIHLLRIDFKLFQAGSTAVAYIYRLYTSFLVQSLIVIIVLGLGALLLIPLAATIRESQSDKSPKKASSNGTTDGHYSNGHNGTRSDDANALDVHVAE
jgi:hypothetical protein